MPESDETEKTEIQIDLEELREKQRELDRRLSYLETRLGIVKHPTGSGIAGQERRTA